MFLQSVIKYEVVAESAKQKINSKATKVCYDEEADQLSERILF